MPGIVTLTLIVVVVALFLVFAAESQRAQGLPPSGSRRRSEPRSFTAPDTAAEPDLSDADLGILAEHVRGLRQAVARGLIGRDEAIASIVRQADGRIREQVAEQLLDRPDAH